MSSKLAARKVKYMLNFDCVNSRFKRTVFKLKTDWKRGQCQKVQNWNLCVLLLVKRAKHMAWREKTTTTICSRGDWGLDQFSQIATDIVLFKINGFPKRVT